MTKVNIRMCVATSVMVAMRAGAAVRSLPDAVANGKISLLQNCTAFELLMGSQAKFILPFAPGSASGILARTVGDKLAGALDQPVAGDKRLVAATLGTAKRKVRCLVC